MKLLLGIFVYIEADFAEIMNLIILKRSNEDIPKKTNYNKIKWSLTKLKYDEGRAL